MITEERLQGIEEAIAAGRGMNTVTSSRPAQIVEKIETLFRGYEELIAAVRELKQDNKRLDELWSETTVELLAVRSRRTKNIKGPR